ncbi:hypothetical protein ACQP00_40685 [Dactylosporangium sp. CS-047395]|uniref:hypothetical protein n=1 Tax=Dactylosporangium sp. CS-047395 TaxID=3239936 RepID=UPI003D8B7713
MIDTRSASTASNKHKGLQRFFRWLLDEDEIGLSDPPRRSTAATRDRSHRPDS